MLNINFKKLLLFLLVILPNNIKSLQEQNLDNQKDNNTDTNIENKKIIRNIIVSGNKLIPTETILIKIPYRIGQIFEPALTGQLIKNLYNLKYFDFIELKTENIDDKYIDLIILLSEKKKIEKIIYEGNNNLSIEEIDKKYKFSDIPTINQEEAYLLAEQIKKLYLEKNYHNVDVKVELEETLHNTIIVKFKITEGPKAIIKKILFEGNKAFTGKVLRSIMFTREDWLLGALDRSGSFDPNLIERDKQTIEYFYQSHGYYTAKVKDVKINLDEKTQCIDLIFYIEEGDIYKLGKITVDTQDKIRQEDALNILPIKTGDIYNKSLIRQSIEILKTLFGQFGYAYADVNPIMQPDFENKTVDIKFETDLGNQMIIDRINITGNYKTRDYVIRRNLVINEGELMTIQGMDISKARVESLGFFDPRDGVSWKINKISDNLAELNLHVKEIRTGKLYGQLGFGGADTKSPLTEHIKVSAGISDRNLFGTGIQYSLNVGFSKEDRNVLFSIYQPWLFNKPIGAGFETYTRRLIYDQFKNTANVPIENTTGFIGNIQIRPLHMPDLVTTLNAGVEKIHYDNKVLVEIVTPNHKEKDLFQSIVNRRFEDGAVNWVGFMTGQDLRNHPTYPSRGYNWTLNGKFCYPVSSSHFSFFKVELDATWLTPLIGDSDLIFLLHGHAGFVKPFLNRNIPYRELFHVGGPATVRGYLYGQIGPQIYGDSLGAQKAIWVNAELIFSVTKDQSIRALLFYDGGAGWDTPSGIKFREFAMQDILRNNSFKYRHSIGFGIRLASPPIKLDWGFKLDRNKKLNEPISEVHFNMAQDF